MSALILPLLFIVVILIAACKKVRVYDSFCRGAKESVPLVLSLFPYLAAMLALASLFEESGLSALLARALSPAFSFLGIPEEIAGLVLVKPFSGSASAAVLADICARFGADSYIARCAAAVYASGETVFYLSAVYYAGLSRRPPAFALAVAAASNLLAVVAACFFCRIF